MLARWRYFVCTLFLIVAVQSVWAGSVTSVTEDKNRPEPPAASAVPVAGVSPPDGFGYVYADSNDPLGPQYNWIDISVTGTNMGLSDDSHYWPINLPFDFNFYGTNYNQVAVGSNGTVYFEDNYLGFGNASIPGSNVYDVNRFIALYWDDLDPEAAGAVYFDVIGSAPNRRLIVQWQDVPHFASSDRVTAQVILLEGSNQILMQYADPSAEAGSDATVGIQGDTSTALQYSYNSASLSANLAICFAPPGIDTTCVDRIVRNVSVPTLSAWALLLLSGMLGVVGLRRKP